MAKEIVPEHLYKYRKLKNRDSFYKLDDKRGVICFDDHGLDALSKGKIWFSHLDYLNDPYENQGDYDASSYYHDLNVYLSSMPSSIPKHVDDFIKELKQNGCPDEEIINLIEMFQEKDARLNVEISHRLRELNKEKMETGVLSLSELKDSLLMWAYYADDHYGYCLEFSSKENHGFNKNRLADNKEVGKVVYNSKYYTFADIKPFYWFVSEKFSEEKLIEYKQRIFCHKSKEWEHEKEWRVFLDITEYKQNENASGALLPFPGKLTTIYCGARMSDVAIEALKDAVRKGNYGYMPKFKKAKLKKGVFGLDFETC